MSILLIRGDARRIPLADNSVNCCVTSPPYWGLRDYGTARWDGGDADCDHKRRPAFQFDAASTLACSKNANQNHAQEPYLEKCGKCGAMRFDSQLGLERTPEEYIAKMVEVFREVKRVLRDDGTIWVNMGDSYASSWPAPNTRRNIIDNPMTDGKRGPQRPERMGGDLKEKDLVGIPWMLAFALRADGWYLRSDIIWAKPNPMPESVTDRPTKAHEYIFLLSKSEKYYYDQDAILEPVSLSTHARLSQDVQSQIASARVPGKTNGNMKAVGRSSRNGSSFDEGKTGEMKHTRGGRRPKAWDSDLGSNRTLVSGYGRKLAEPGSGTKNNSSFDEAMAIMPEKRNKRSVWEVNTQPYSEAHFATFPEELIKPCILAGCPEGGVVLDPFVGSGTTLLVARNNQCHAVGIELSEPYLAIARRRLAQDVLAFV